MEAREHVAQLALEHERVVLFGLHAHQEAVERGNVDTGRVEAALERLHERRPRACKRVEHPAARRDMPTEQLLHELGDVLAEIGMESVDVLRPLAFRQVTLRPGEVEIEAGVQLFLRRPHAGGIRRRWDVSSERVGNVLDPAAADRDHVEPHLEAG